MMISEDVTASLIPLDLGGPIIARPRNQPSSVIELGKKLLQGSREGDTRAVLALMSKGAPFTTDWLGTSPLHLAAMNNHYDTCDVLLRAGIGKDARTKVDRTPLHFAAYEGHANITKLLLNNDVEVDCIDMLRMTPLHWAVERGHIECVRALLQSGASPHALSKFNKSPLSIAAEMDWLEMVDLLHMSSTLEATQSIESDIPAGDIQETQPEYTIQDDDILNINHTITTKPDPDNPSAIDELDGDVMDADKDVQNTLADFLPRAVEDYTNDATLQLLKEHGITMLPTDNTNTVTSAVQSGRKIVLSDAGKLVLKDCKFQKEPPKPVDIKKKPIILPTGKLKNTKIYTMSSSQFLAMTGQAKPNILQKVPLDTIKKAVVNAGLNFVQIPKSPQLNMNPSKITPLTKTVNIANTLNAKPVPGTITVVKKSKGNMLTVPSTIKREVISLNQFTAQGKKAKVIQIKGGGAFNNAVKIVVNKNTLGKFISQMPSNTNQITNGTTIKKEPAPKILEKNSFSVNTVAEDNLIEIDRLRTELYATKLEVELYKKKLEEVQAEMQTYKDKLYCHNLLELETEGIE